MNAEIVQIAGTIDIATVPETRSWYAVHARSRHEKLVHAHLQHRQVVSFLPTYKSLRKWKDRRIELDFPLFPGYLFVEISLRDQVAVLQVPGVVRLVGCGYTPTPLNSVQIEALRAGLLKGRIEPHPYLSIGERVRITKGPFAGVEGVLKAKKNSVSVIVSIEAILQAIAVEVRADDVEPVRPSLSYQQTEIQNRTAIQRYRV